MTRPSSFLSRRPSSSSLFSGLVSVVRRPSSGFSASGLASGVWRPVFSSGCRPSFVVCLLLFRTGVRRPASGVCLQSAFTLLEVMLVIGILAILAALLFPVVIGASAKAKQKQALTDTRNIAVAIKAYRQEYGKWPAQTQAATDTTYITNNYCVIQPLLGSNITVGGRPTNPKNKIFLDLQTSTNNPDYAGNYLDPWGIPYVICMDENGDNGLSIVWSNIPPYVASNPSGRQIGATNIYLTNYPVASTDAGAASLGGSSNSLPYNSWTEMP